MIILDLLQQSWWIHLNRAIPFFALAISGLVILSDKYCTKDKITSTMYAAIIIMWSGLILADWGSVVFRPSPQTVFSRFTLLFILGIQVFKTRNNTKRMNDLEAENTTLKALLESKGIHYDKQRIF